MGLCFGHYKGGQAYETCNYNKQKILEPVQAR